MKKAIGYKSNAKRVGPSNKSFVPAMVKATSSASPKPFTGPAEKLKHKGRAGFLMRQKWAEEKQKTEISRNSDSSPKLVETNKQSTGWGNVAQWYHETVEDVASYQRDLIMPNLLRLMEIKPGQKILDLGCGEGLFTRRFAKAGAEMTAIDIATSLVDIAKRACASESELYKFQPRFFVSNAESIPMVADASQDMVLINLAIQNIENVGNVFKECARVLKTNGKLFLVLNHPAFRIPKASGWEWSSDNKIQYRQESRYMSESREKIDMAPSVKGRVGSEQTISFHRPLQFFVKLLGKNGLAIVNMEEWVSGKKSLPGPRADAENTARKEFPLFMMIEVVKI
jgi:ubiquinone/menaquinone biosynthesis C-methylase UbiE